MGIPVEGDMGISPRGETGSLSERLPEEIFNRIHEDAGKFMTSWKNTEVGEYDYIYAADVALELCRFIADQREEVVYRVLEYFRKYVHQWEQKGIDPDFGSIWDMIHCAGKEDYLK